MTDIFYEYIVLRKNGMKEFITISLAIIIGLVLVLLSLTNLFFVLILVIYIFLCNYLKFPSTHIEFEYALLNNEMSIDKIINKSKRKKLKSFNVKDIILLTGIDSNELKQYNGVKQYNYSSNNQENKIYALIVKNNINTETYLLDLDNKLIEMISLYSKNSIKL